MIINTILTNIQKPILTTILTSISDNDPSPTADKALLEDGFYILMENGYGILIKT